MNLTNFSLSSPRIKPSSQWEISYTEWGRI